MKILRRRNKIMIFLVVVLGAAFILSVAGATLQGTFFKGKLKQIQQYGKLVDVYDGQMHVYSMGKGDKTIVLLPGMGVGLPSADFSPLMRELSKKYTVVALEYFGVGFSTTTERPRTTDNYVEEIRTALNVAGIKGPYILMSHSISSVYSEYYASKYPQELEAIVSLDGTSTAFYGDMPSFIKYLLPVAKFQQTVGTLSILANVTTNKERLLSYGYREKEISDMITYGGFALNNNILEQIAKTPEYIKDTMALTYPESVPYFKVISRTTYETPNKQLKMPPQEYQHQHLERIGVNAAYEILEGSHFIYANNAKRIEEIVGELLSGRN